jgi:hypothetical protein
MTDSPEKKEKLLRGLVNPGNPSLSKRRIMN